MHRQSKFYPPEERRFFEENIQCVYCGNTTAFNIDLRLRHEISVINSGQLAVSINKTKINRILKTLAKNIQNLIDKAQEHDRAIITCANCKESNVENQWRLIDYCWQLGCGGCEICANYIEESDLREYCLDCIAETKGSITDEECSYSCPNFDFGLEAVRIHYNITLDELKRELGY